MNRDLSTRFRASGPGGEALTRLYEDALQNLHGNTVPDPGTDQNFFRAGRGYPDPWTRDASINSWFAGNLIDPETSRHTLDRVTDHALTGRVIAQDNQWWDQAVWVIAAWEHYLMTGNSEFLGQAHDVAQRSLAILRISHFSDELGLYLGPAFMQDGISGFPTPPNDRDGTSSFVLDYPAAWNIACLSTNSIYVGAYQSLADMAQELGRDASASRGEAERLSRAIRQYFAQTTPAPYFVRSTGGGAADTDRSVEAAGIALAALFGVFTEEESHRQLAALWREPAGVVNVWPHFDDRYSDQRPGRHNVLCWPVVMGLVNLACIKVGATGLFLRGLDDLVALFTASGGSFFETYNARTGLPDGGWQVGRTWESEPDQTWSATAFLASVNTGIVGLSVHSSGMTIRPRLPPGIDAVSVENLRYRSSILTITIERPAAGTQPEAPAQTVVPAGTTGALAIHLHVAAQ